MKAVHSIQVPPPPPEARAILDTPEGATLLRWLEIRNSAIEASLEAGEQRFESLEDELQQLRADLLTNTAATQRIERSQDRMGSALMENIKVTKGIEKSSGEMLQAFQAAKGGFTVLQWLGKVVAPISAFIGLGIGLYAAWQKFKGAG